MEFDKFVKGIPGWDTHGIKGMNLIILGKSLPICVHIYDSDENIDREISHFVFQISISRQVGCWALQVYSIIFTV